MKEEIARVRSYLWLVFRMWEKNATLTLFFLYRCSYNVRKIHFPAADEIQFFSSYFQLLCSLCCRNRIVMFSQDSVTNMWFYCSCRCLGVNGKTPRFGLRQTKELQQDSIFKFTIGARLRINFLVPRPPCCHRVFHSVIATVLTFRIICDSDSVIHYQFPIYLVRCSILWCFKCKTRFVLCSYQQIYHKRNRLESGSYEICIPISHGTPNYTRYPARITDCRDDVPPGIPTRETWAKTRQQQGEVKERYMQSLAGDDDETEGGAVKGDGLLGYRTLGEYAFLLPDVIKNLLGKAAR